jgi:hypothetical protein
VLRSRLSERGDAIAGAVVGACLVLMAATTTGGSTLGPNTWTEIVLLTIGALTGGWLLIAGRRLRGPALVAVVAFVALALYTALSIAWSVTPDLSWLEAARTAGYLAAFVAACLLARLAPQRWRVLLGALALAAITLSAWAVVAKVFDLGTSGQSQYGRLLAPFGYWNATGLMAAMGMPALLWAGRRREGGRLARGAAVPAISLLATVVILSYSRTALAAAVVGCLICVSFGQTRLRAVLVLALGWAGAAVICAWALGDAALTSDRVAGPARVSAGHSFGLVVVAVLAVCCGVGFLAAFMADRTHLTAATRRRIGVVLVGALGLAPVVVMIALAVSSRGFTGEISHVWSTLTSSQARVGDQPGRLVDFSNSRPRYWHQALSVTGDHLIAGAGAGSFGTAHLRYATAHLTATNAEHAHSYVLETLADLGVIGLAISLVLLASWAVACRRALHRGATLGGPGSTAEGDGLWALLAVVLVFGVSSSVDWTWFYPGLAVPALVCAGWLAGRTAFPGGPAGALERPALSMAELSRRPKLILGLTGVVAATVAVAWGVWQPLRSADATNAGITALTHGNVRAALADAQSAAAEDPVALEPLQELSAIYQALGDPSAARAELVKATTVQPENPVPWSWLGAYDLGRRSGRAASELRRAAALDVTNAGVRAQLAAAARGQGG